jgi:hypothetical protein
MSDMTCSNNTSTIIIRLDKDERFVSFIYQRSFCGQVINEKSIYSQLCQGKTLTEILHADFPSVLKSIPTPGEEDRFLLFMEWDALRSALGQYLGLDDADIDVARCQTVAVKHDDEGIEITQFILPPSRLPNEKDREAILGTCGPGKLP